jgi:hypothetical protein
VAAPGDDGQPPPGQGLGHGASGVRREVAAALQDYASGDADFADALLSRSGRAARCHQPATFNRRLLALPDTVEP